MHLLHTGVVIEIILNNIMHCIWNYCVTPNSVQSRNDKNQNNIENAIDKFILYKIYKT